MVLLTLVLMLVSLVFSATSQSFKKPSNSPFEQSSNYVGKSNGTILNSPLVPGAQFDRFVQIFLENTDYATAASSPTFQKLAKQGITLTNYHALYHPSEPNYLAVVSGSNQGVTGDDSRWRSYTPLPSKIKTIVDLLEPKGISWATYAENLPYDGFVGLDFSSKNYLSPGSRDYTYYVRRHNPLAMFSSVMSNRARSSRIRNFNDFAVDVSANSLPQWMFITPNMVNDAHDTDIDFSSEWLNYFLIPLLADKRFNNDRTLVLLTFDEDESRASGNRIYTLALGGAIHVNLRGTSDSTYYTHYSSLSTVENNWGIPIGALNSGDNGANVYSWVAQVTGHQNNRLTALPGNVDSTPGYGSDGDSKRSWFGRWKRSATVKKRVG